MKSLNPYLTFNGNCREALHFYQQCFDNASVDISPFGEMPGEQVPDEDKDKIMHAEFRAGGIFFMASDSMGGPPITPSTQISMSIQCNTEQEQEIIFNKLADGGSVTMPLQDVFWGSRFGMLIDRFGIMWLLSCDKPQN